METYQPEQNRSDVREKIVKKKHCKTKTAEKVMAAAGMRYSECLSGLEALQAIHADVLRMKYSGHT